MTRQSVFRSGDKTLVMGVVNVTPDSFSDGGRFLSADSAFEQAAQLVADGADILDVGGESSRPGADPTPEQVELDRVAPVIERIAAELSVSVSIDTYKPRVAGECLKLGATIINDINGLRDEEMVAVAGKSGSAVVIMHMLGRPKTMQADPRYDDLIGELRAFLEDRARAAIDAGVKDIALDPGLGFGKTVAQNYEILRRLDEFRELGWPLLAGPSRKSFLGRLASQLPVEQRLEGTIAASCAAAMNGADIVRVHDVKECRRALDVIDAIRYGPNTDS